MDVLTLANSMPAKNPIHKSVMEKFRLWQNKKLDYFNPLNKKMF